MVAFAVAACAQSAPPLKVVVTEGDGAINNATSGRAREPVVVVRDDDNRPLANAAVTFVAPQAGPGGVFTNGSAILTVTTDSEGRAVGRGFRPNRIAGPFEIRVTASAKGQQGSVIVRQTNAAVSSGGGSGKKRAALVAVIGAAVAGGLIAAMGGGGDSSTSPGATPTPPRSAVLVPGSPSIGAP